MTGLLSRYIARRFAVAVLSVFAAAFLLVAIVDLVELLRANKRGSAGFADLIGMAMLRAPSITIKAAPFIVLLGAMTAFASLARSSELVVARASGVSAWRIIQPALIVASLLGVVSFAVYNPVASAFAARFETLEERFFERTSSRVAISGTGIWLRQTNGDGQTVIRAQRASRAVDTLWEVSAFEFDAQDRLLSRINARAAALEVGAWRLSGAHVWRFDQGDGNTDDSALQDVAGERLDTLRLETDLTVDRIQESFADPQTIGFWSLPGFISNLETSGFSSYRHRMHWHSLLTAPVVFLAMVLIGAAFSMRHARFGGLGMMALGCVISGFGFFFLSDVTNALGASGSIPVVVAAWAPPVSAVLFALGLLLHIEDG